MGKIADHTISISVFGQIPNPRNDDGDGDDDDDDDMAHRETVLTPRAIEGMIADGHIITIYEDSVLRLDAWLDKHPGGRLAILHMVGRDATDEINA
ncbi:hypothetical protein F5Y16DRAFT_406284 [Xylariaceae sp. FL0255]|nr:hypothetical protein F5Y16DRAFT_406284 [Xylariaceae sp. FL0255]